ncbi:hypothetical protein GCK72_000354 [Caenorhabditis remanei]|uniref:Uncharacterized protein n=1 Tax=Caenorhabditis remanei TaxID=31234 RepID=A0A6A5HS04_CAERE|nr:hypothetical protein GCK72_000354 [Caenorhabditis remanei]KAF1768542.1 hypothetical protein GCK72_000354 [Caenorhabditis remanei]
MNGLSNGVGGFENDLADAFIGTDWTRIGRGVISGFSTVAEDVERIGVSIENYLITCNFLIGISEGN